MPTQKFRLCLTLAVARSIVDNIFDAVSGDAIYRRESFLAGKLGEKVASERLTVIDDGTIPGLFGSSHSTMKAFPRDVPSSSSAAC